MKQKSKRTQIFIKCLTVLLTLLLIVLLAFYLFNLLGGEDTIMNQFQQWTSKNVVLACALYLILTPLINIIPGISSLFFITIANMMFNNQTTKGMIFSFLLAMGGVILSSTLLFLLGRLVGKKIIGWIIGKDDFEKAEKILTYGGKAALPFVYLLPMFPDDTICFVAGCTKMSFLYNFINVLLFRSVGVLVTCIVGTNYFDYSSFTWWQWCIVVAVVFIGILILFFVTRAYYRYLRKREEGNKYVLTRGLKLPKKN